MTRRTVVVVFAALATLTAACTATDTSPDATAARFDWVDTTPTLVDDCLAGDMAACDTLDTDTSPGDWFDEVSDTCGYRVTLDPAATCVTRVGEVTTTKINVPPVPTATGPWDPDLPSADPDVADTTDDRCLEGSWEHCDLLVETTARGSDLFTLGASCGYLLPRDLPTDSCADLNLPPVDVGDATPAEIAADRFPSWDNPPQPAPTDLPPSDSDPEPVEPPTPDSDPEADRPAPGPFDPTRAALPPPPPAFVGRPIEARHPTDMDPERYRTLPRTDWDAERCIHGHYMECWFLYMASAKGSWYEHVAITCGFRVDRCHPVYDGCDCRALDPPDPPPLGR